MLRRTGSCRRSVKTVPRPEAAVNFDAAPGDSYESHIAPPRRGLAWAQYGGRREIVIQEEYAR